MAETPEMRELRELLALLAEPEETETTFSLELPEKVADAREWALEFAEKVMRPAAPEWDKSGEFPWPVVQEAAKVGLYSLRPLLMAEKEKSGLLLPAGIVEPLFWGDPGLAMAIMGSALAVAAINVNGSKDQIVEWAFQCYGTPNDVKLGALCVSEDHAGSDVGAISTKAVYYEANDEWEITGNKEWITNGSYANVYVVVASVDPELGSRGHASLIVPAGTKGLIPGKGHDKIGIRASNTAPVGFDHVRVPGRNLLMKGGKEQLDERLAKAWEAKRLAETQDANNPAKAPSSGKQPAMATFEATRTLVGAMAVGIGSAALDYSLQYAKDRKAFGTPIIQKQLIADKIAEMATEIDAARLLVWRAAWLAKNGGFKRGEGSMSKWKASEVAVKATRDAIQILGGAGFTKAHPVERWHRDSLIMTIFEGTSEIQELLIASALSGQTIR